jgi:hypothetical protein
MGVDMPSHHPKTEATADPIKRGEPQASQNPNPLDASEACKKGRKIVAVQQRNPPTQQRSDDEYFEAA